MDRTELGQKLNSVLENVDLIQDGLDSERHRRRIDVVRDQLVLLALDMGLPVVPAKATHASDPGQRPPTG